MLFYQGTIMLLTAACIYILAMFLRRRNRKLLVGLIVLILVVGGSGMYYVQYYFGNHFYNQNIDSDMITQLSVADGKKANVKKLFSDYSAVTPSKYAKNSIAVGKAYTVSTPAGRSAINVDIYSFGDKKSADSYFQSSQRFYENKGYIPLDGEHSKKVSTGGPCYLISFIESKYKDYGDFIYLPSKITYSSDVVVQSGNMVIEITESANRPVTNKESVISDIIKRLKKA